MEVELKDISTAYLQAELDRRLGVELAVQKPEILVFPNITALQIICQEYIDAIETDVDLQEDYDHYIFETAMETVFGEGVWEYVNFKLT